MIGLMYRHVPVVEYAKELIATRELGAITHYRSLFLADYAADPKGVLTWRYKPDDAGLGVLGDIMPHTVDMAQNLLGSIDSASAKKESYQGAPGGAGGHGDGLLRCRGWGEVIRRERRLRGQPVRFENGARDAGEQPPPHRAVRQEQLRGHRHLRRPLLRLPAPESARAVSLRQYGQSGLPHSIRRVGHGLRMPKSRWRII
jgi:predicted dehydrogenase